MLTDKEFKKWTANLLNVLQRRDGDDEKCPMCRAAYIDGRVAHTKGCNLAFVLREAERDGQ